MMAMIFNLMDAIDVNILVNQVVNVFKENVIESKFLVNMDIIIHIQAYHVNHFVEMEYLQSLLKNAMMVMRLLTMNVIYVSYNVVLNVKHVRPKIFALNVKKVMNYLIIDAMN